MMPRPPLLAVSRTVPARRRHQAVLHLAWDGRTLHAWAEQPPRFTPGQPPPAATRVPPHPYAVDGPALAALLRLGRRAAGAPARIGLRLPVRRVGAVPGRLRPVPSVWLGGPARGRFALAPFRVPVLPLLPEGMLRLLCAPVEADAVPGGGAEGPFGRLPAEMALGPDAVFWRRVARLGLAACAGGGFVPGLGSGVRGGTAVALWQPALDTPAREAAAALAAAMPAVCRQAAPQLPPEVLVTTLLERVVDLAVRATLGAERVRIGRSLRADRSGDRWLLALLHAVPIPVVGADRLAPLVSAWTAQVRTAATASVRVLLLLGQPREGPDPEVGPLWPLEIAAQRQAPDGSPAEAVRAEALAAPTAGDLRNAAQRLLREAAAAFPCLAPAAGPDWRGRLQPPWREVVPLLDQRQAELESYGISVLAPAWWTAGPARPTARLHLRDADPAPGPKGGGAAAGDLTGFRWEAVVDGEVVPADVFEALVRNRQSLVRLRSGWTRLDPEVVRQLATRWEESGVQGRLPAAAGLRLALESAVALAGAPGGVDAVALDAQGRVAEWLERLVGAGGVEPLAEPDGFRGSLRPYQRQGLGWLARLAELGMGGCLADDMGLGKTVQVIALVLRRRVVPGRAATLLVCPTSVVGNWQAELARFAPGLSVHVHHGSRRPRAEGLRQLAVLADVVLTSYALLVRDREALAGLGWDGVVLDEAQNIKNPQSLQARAARGLRAGWRLALTGTPVENRLLDLWSIFAFALPGYLGGARAFNRAYAAPIGRGEAAAAAGLRQVLEPFLLRRTKSDPQVAADLPPVITTRERCPLTTEQAALYEAVTREALGRIGQSRGMERRAAVLTTLLRLKQICDHPALFGGTQDDRLEGRSGKLRRLEELLDEVGATGERALVFTQFAAWARRLAPYLQRRLGCPVWLLDGAMDARTRTAAVRAFQEGEGAGALVLSLKAGGSGLNLTAARHVFHYDRWWNPAVEQQATDRAHRIGQTATVQVHTLIVPGTVESRVDRILRDKAAVAAKVVGGGAAESWLTELDTAELTELLALRRDEGEGA